MRTTRTPSEPRTTLRGPLAEQGQLDPAETLLDEALEGTAASARRGARNTLRSMDYRATVLEEGGRREEAREQAVQTLEASRRGLGEKHRDTVARKAKLAFWRGRRVRRGGLTDWMKGRSGLL